MMKKHMKLLQKAQRYLIRPALRYRHIWLPVAAAAGVAFFILCDYVAYAIVAFAFVFIWLYYALFLICRFTNVEVCRDEQGNIFIQYKEEATEQKSEKS
jgi:hypothetical protein